MRSWPEDPNMLRRKLDNQRPAHHDRQRKVKTKRERDEWMSEAHLACIRQLWCTKCGTNVDIEAHHLRSGPAKKWRGYGLRTVDAWVLPLCRWSCHPEADRAGARGELRFYADFGFFDPYGCADMMWRATGNVELMRNILRAHQLQAEERKAEEVEKLSAKLNRMLARRKP